MELDFHDKPVENELDRMFDYDVDGALSPVEQSYKLDFMTGDIEGDGEECFDLKGGQHGIFRCSGRKFFRQIV